MSLHEDSIALLRQMVRIPALSGKEEAVAACVGTAALLMPERTDTYVSGNLQCCADDACSRVNVMIASL